MRFGHIPLLIILQVIFIILFAVFVVYDPKSVVPHGSKFAKKFKPNEALTEEQNKAGKTAFAEDYQTNAEGAYSGYPLFQDVHVMIFIGFGFLMTFLKKYGLSAMSLNMLIAVICLQWATLVYGFFHLEWKDPNGNDLAIPQIYMNQVKSMLYSDFAAATVLISFGVIIGTTSPLQLIVMALIEIVLFFVNEIIGRNYLHAIDAGDTIFVHTFGAYFGLGVSRILYTRALAKDNKNEGSDYTHDHFSMIGTIFLWLFWPSFNSATAVTGDAQQRAILNTYFSLCACVVTAFATSSFMNDQKKFVMEHIQNATLAGGVAIGAVADLMVGPWAALVIGSVAGIVSVLGYDILGPYLKKRFKIHDTCGVHNLHGMPGVLGSLLSCIVVSFANSDIYGVKGLADIFPRIGNTYNDSYDEPYVFTANHQAVGQFSAFIVTMVIATFGGLLTGFLLKAIGNCQDLQRPKTGSTVMKMAQSIQGSIASAAGIELTNLDENLFSDEMFFEVHADEKDRRASLIATDKANYKRRSSLSMQPSPKM